MKKPKFPSGWNPEPAKKVLAHYESQPGDEAVAEYEAAFEGLRQKVRFFLKKGD